MADEVVASEKDEKVITPVVNPDAALVVETVVKEPRVYTQEELDRITAKVKKNARYQTRKEIEAYYQGRDSRPEVKETKTEDKPPERASFDSYEEFLDAKAAFTGRKAAREERLKTEKEIQESKSAEERQKVFTNFQTKVREKFPDIEERIEAISEISMSDTVLQAIAESDLGPDILSHFADNPKDCERIAALSPSSAVREIGKLEARLDKPEANKSVESKETKTEIPKKEASKAPTPINPGGGGSPSDDTPKDTDSIDDWMRKERARGRKKTGT